MTSINFNSIRKLADERGANLNSIRDKFFEELISEHKKTYSTVSPCLYNIFLDNRRPKLDLSSIGLNIKIEEKFIFLGDSIVKKISFLHYDELRLIVVPIIDFFLHENSKFTVLQDGQYVGELGNGYVYDNFFKYLFKELQEKELITATY